MCVCVCVCMCMCVCACTHASISARIYTGPGWAIAVILLESMCVCVYVCMGVCCVCEFTHASISARIYAGPGWAIAVILLESMCVCFHSENHSTATACGWLMHVLFQKCTEKRCHGVRAFPSGEGTRRLVCYPGGLRKYALVSSIRSVRQQHCALPTNMYTVDH